jgi:chaperone modulatory protein CbpM
MSEDVHWLDEGRELSTAEFAALSGIPEDLLLELVGTGVIVVREVARQRYLCTARTVHIARKAGRLHRDFELDASGLTVALRLLERVHELELDVRRLRAELARVD